MNDEYDDGFEIDLPQAAAIVIVVFVIGFIMGTLA